MQDINVYVHKIIIGVVNDVNTHLVLVIKFWQEVDVFVQQVKTGMDLFVWNALMVKNGTNNHFLVNVQLDMNGLVFSARKPITVLPTEYGMRPFKHVFVLQMKSGTEENAQFSQNVVEEEFGI